MDLDKIYSIIGKRIRNFRKSLGYSQETLGKKIGVAYTYIGQIERGEKRASFHSLLKIANALELPLEVLFENIILNEKEVETVSSECYELIDALTLKEQKVMLKLIKEIIEYGEVSK
ncbi:helix-turn-helix domain-containing protein [Clostridioides difficile]|uniref:helix-turn-helix domain-containing protein n=1 Tax=Clostridioides difficile TaxID=1496 RepID=UPI001C1873D1|nr:helix-turn-helix transcriptional regulator [Clostridioides difficile]EKJ1811763.1 helix-turn-helix transcriptional regulator [Clostridioides difficile]MBZ0658244.1 helix-turn-helix domain-containing protein [Clostridioides difficile]MCP8415636.1 helix-turn-helix domain-containing protein [Clostridioides difficile]MCP8664516.1 helix-turn-helix domain-containing protein [Clostridioides difficile]MDV9368789.1 helix-turn-helix transcriptional regulator [Clostridioides difficile]